jgi:hypothetical protein
VEPILVFPEPAPPELAQVLDLGGYPWKAVNDDITAQRMAPNAGWSGAVICAYADPERAFALCRTLRRSDNELAPLMILVNGTQLAELEQRGELFEDFCLSPFHPRRHQEIP